jgi:ATP synthase F1 gamma subunit
MSDVKTQQRHIEDLRSAQYITGALRDISAIELKALRGRFERNTQFTDELRDLFGLVWSIALRTEGAVDSGKKKETLYVAYTTNRHFYGALNYDVVKKVIKDTDTHDRCLIVGDTGKEVWKANAKKRKEVTFMSFKSDEPDQEETKSFLELSRDFSRVFVYYPGFVSVFAQEPRMLDITFRPSKKAANASGQGAGGEEAEYLLEPDLTEMLMFFNTQVRYVLFERMLLETQLSRVAARLAKMDAADTNAEQLIKNERKELRRANASFSSRRMIETLVGYLQWHTQRT